MISNTIYSQKAGKVLKELLSLLPLYLFALLPMLSSCSDDDLDSQSIFTDEETTPTAFDSWIKTNFTDPYNIRFIYRYVDYETDNTYNVVPPDVTKAQAAAKLIKHLWVDAYVEVMDADFIKQYAPRIYQLIGSNEYNTNNSVVMGLAEGGVKVTLFGLNALDPDSVLIDTDSPTPNRSTDPIDLNYKVFETIHHEFCHILTQQKDYSTDFRTISSGDYHTSDWINVGDEEALQAGFVTNYASGEYNEDFAETYAVYVTKSDAGWEALLEAAGDTGAATIESKLDIVRNYFSSQWGLDIDQLRTVVQRRTAEARIMDLRTLN